MSLGAMLVMIAAQVLVVGAFGYCLWRLVRAPHDDD